MSRKIEKTFVVAVSVEHAWKAMTDPGELNKWYAPFDVAEDGSHTTEILGEERRSEVVEFDPPRKVVTRTVLTGHEAWGVIPGTRDMTVVLEATDAGTKIVITHSGFGNGEDWERELEAASHGTDETIADLVLYLETGVAFPRHNRGEKSYHGIAAQPTRAGLKVVAVQAGTYGERLGLVAGDILVELGSAGLFGLAELQFFSKEHKAGEKVTAAWIRDGRLMRGSAQLGSRVAVESPISA
jgi:uncharacterized protein YndB with AHSA1/START domain